MVKTEVLKIHQSSANAPCTLHGGFIKAPELEKNDCTYSKSAV